MSAAAAAARLNAKRRGWQPGWGRGPEGEGSAKAGRRRRIIDMVIEDPIEDRFFLAMSRSGLEFKICDQSC